MTATRPVNDQPPEGMPDEFSSRHLRRRVIGFAVVIAFIAIAILTLPGLGSIRHRFSQADWRLLLLIGVLKYASCLSNILAFRDVFSRKMSPLFAYRLGMSEQAANVLLPTGGAGGLALGAWALHRGGMDNEHIGRRSVCFFVLTSIPNFLVLVILGPLLLLNVFHGKHPTAPTLIFTVLAIGGSVLIALLPYGMRHIHRIRDGRLSGRLRVALTSLYYGILDTGTLLRHRRWRAIVGACGYLGFDIAALMVAFAAFGSHKAVPPLIFGYVVGQLGGLIPIPGGIGGADGGLIGCSSLYGARWSVATAAVLAYRAFQIGIPAIFGAISFVFLRRTLTGENPPHLEEWSHLEHERPREPATAVASGDRA